MGGVPYKMGHMVGFNRQLARISFHDFTADTKNIAKIGLLKIM